MSIENGLFSFLSYILCFAAICFLRWKVLYFQIYRPDIKIFIISPDLWDISQPWRQNHLIDNGHCCLTLPSGPCRFRQVFLAKYGSNHLLLFAQVAFQPDCLPYFLSQIRLVSPGKTEPNPYEIFIQFLSPDFSLPILGSSHVTLNSCGFKIN